MPHTSPIQNPAVVQADTSFWDPTTTTTPAKTMAPFTPPVKSLKCHVGGIRSRVRRHLHQLQRRRPTTDHTRGNGTPTAAQPCPNQQFHHRRHQEFNHAKKRSKAMDMRFLLGAGSIKQKQFNVFWKPGSTNFGDYAPIHHRNVMTHYIHCPGVPRQAYARVC